MEMKKPARWAGSFRFGSGGRISPSLLRSEVGLGAFADATHRAACG